MSRYPTPEPARAEPVGGDRVVPVEPTAEMIEAGTRAEWEACFTGDYYDPAPEDVSRDACREGAIVAYRAMVAAAPALVPAPDAGLAEVERLLSTALSEAHTAGQFGQTLDNGFVPHWQDKVLSAFSALRAERDRLRAEMVDEAGRRLDALQAARNAIRWASFSAHKDSLVDAEKVSDIAAISDAALSAADVALNAARAFDRARIAAAPAPATTDNSGDTHA